MPTWLHYLRTFEPARLRAAYTAIIALALALGISIPAQVDGKITALIGALAVVLPLLQGETTRAAVVPAAVVPKASDNAPRPGDQAAANQAPTPDLTGLTAQDVAP